MGKIERKYLAHFLDASFGAEPLNYVRLGADLEEYIEELNPDVETKKNILGEQTINHNGYEVSSEVEPYYADYDDPLAVKLQEIANERKTGNGLITTKVDVLLAEDGTCVWAYRENVWVIPNSVGGDTSGVQIPFTIYNAGGRVKGTFDIATKTFTPEAEADAGEGNEVQDPEAEA